MKSIISLLLLIFSIGVTGQKTFINPPQLIKPNGYTHVVVSTGGKTIYIACQVPFSADGKLVGAGDFRAQVKQAFNNLKSALEAQVLHWRM